MATPARMQYEKWCKSFARESKRNPIGGVRLARRRRELAAQPKQDPQQEYNKLCLAPPTFSSSCTCGGDYGTRIRATPAVPPAPERPSQPRTKPRRVRYSALAMVPAELGGVERTMMESGVPRPATIQICRDKLGPTPLGHPPRRRYIVQKSNGSSSIFARQKALRTGTARIATRPVLVASWQKKRRHVPVNVQAKLNLLAKIV